MKTKLHHFIKTKTTQIKIAFAFLLTFNSFLVLTAQIAPAWVQFSSPANFQNFDVKEVSVGVDTLGNVYTSASISDTINNLSKIMLVKHNVAGVQQWIKYYDNSNPNLSDSYAVSLLVDKTGNSYISGYGRNNSTDGKDFLLIKYDNTGFQQWVKYWDGGQSQYDYATCSTFDAAGNIIVAGYANNFGTNGDDIAVVKWGISGTQIWSYIYNNPTSNGEDRALSVSSDHANNIFITGSSYVTNARNMITLKLNSSGLNQWTKIVPHANASSDERGYSVTADASGNSYVTGASGDWITIKYDAAGTILWTNHYTTNALNDYNLKKVMLDKNNNVIVTGDAFVNGGHFSDLVVTKINNTTGLSLWSINVNNGGIDDFTDAAIDTSGNIYIGGYFEGPLSSDMSAMIVSPSGLIVWNTSYTNPSHAAGADFPYHIAVDRSRNFILAGLAERRGSGSTDAVDVITLKYSALITGILENKLQSASVSVYPNPTHSKITILSQNIDLIGASLTITNAMGQLIKREILENEEQEVNLEGFTKGIYMLRITHTSSTATAKIIVE